MMKRSNPFSDFDDLFERMSRQFDEMGRQFDGQGRLPIDVVEYDGEIVVTADLPGFARDDIDLTVSGEHLTIRAERETEGSEGDDAYVHKERRHTSMRRTISLPVDVDEEAASATYTNGVLTITLPKLDVDADSHRIDID